MACRLFSTKPLSELMRAYLIGLLETQWNVNSNSNFIIEKETFESVVCKMTANFLGPNVLTSSVDSLFLFDILLSMAIKSELYE